MRVIRPESVAWATVFCCDGCRRKLEVEKSDLRVIDSGPDGYGTSGSSGSELYVIFDCPRCRTMNFPSRKKLPDAVRCELISAYLQNHG